MKKRILLKIRGKVQGVFFRVSAIEKAKGLGLVGWVKNNLDGSVSIIAEGEEQALGEMLQWCEKEGSEYSKTEKLDIKWEKVQNDFRGFVIK